MKINKFYFITLTVLMMSCGSDPFDPENSEPYHPPFDLFMELPQDENGYYQMDYPNDNSNWYVQVFVQTEGLHRVFWYSPNTFNVEYQGQTFTDKIVCCSTYTNSQTGQTRQNVYLNQSMLNDTLIVYGYISEEVIDYVQIVVY